ncbi:25673_t:CDS:2 [Dentiscutata erythropus]|uniref:25673_t:CDS:1 n=1 Tax=Dentiscutata erythropus TaxID=1348616 RepID=A0A9N8WR40_9GLOM|nr:25673_t:CDS:2 [Dentiscutata erythropus]
MESTNIVRSTQILTQTIELNNELEPHVPIKESIAQQFQNRGVHAVSVDYDNSPNSKKTVLKNPECANGFVAAIFQAYNQHQHLRLSPDDVWLTIAQGVSRHINFNAEKFRSRFVKHEGKEDIYVDVTGVIDLNLKGDWPEVVNRFVVEADKRVEKIDLTQLLVCNFSTTTPISLTASRIVLMDMVKAYFSYSCGTCCGIPKVTLEGTLEDWTKLQEKVMQLRQLNLELDFWLDRLEPVILKLVATYNGDIDEDFWSRIMNKYTRYGSGGGTFITGWILGFFPYNHAGNALHQNHSKFENFPPPGTVEVPFKFTDTNHSLKFISGFIGADQEISDGEAIVSPVIGCGFYDSRPESDTYV